jgi:tRNA(Ile)-lysidine synthase
MQRSLRPFITDFHIMDLLAAFKTYISEQELFHPSDRLLLAVSGGVDSVVLCRLCSEAGFPFAIAHANFQLRGEESNRDHAFVKKLAEEYKATLFENFFDTKTFALEKKLSIQEAARALRYEWFSQILDDGQLIFRPQFVLTAHHADDNVETMMMHFFKGTGIAGLRGILPKQGSLLRPLLFARRADILDFAKERKLAWVEDSSNATDHYARNYFRHRVIPIVEEIFPGAISNLEKNAIRFREIEALYDEAVARHKKNLLEKNGNEFHIPVLKLKKSKPLRTIVFEIFRDFNFRPSQISDLIDLLDAPTGKYLSSPSHRVIRNRAWLVIAENNSNAEGLLVLDAPGKKTIFDAGRRTIELAQKNAEGWQPPITAMPGMMVVDASAVEFPLVLRRWKTGDYFYPLGMKKKKKLARFFIDQKLSKTAKENTWVLESNKKIITVLGHRIDDRFRVTGATSSILLITTGQVGL